uniref:Uncharacterized protein n=1 Tax=Panagrolaimus sp. PS1159 TaxID=55785 RepID=A0AC35F1Z1_9BILA
MKLFFKTFFFSFVVLSLEFLDSISAPKFHHYGNASNDSGTLGSNIQKQDIRSSDVMLLFERNEHDENDGEDVILSETGPINITLTHENGDEKKSLLGFWITLGCAILLFLILLFGGIFACVWRIKHGETVKEIFWPK